MVGVLNVTPDSFSDGGLYADAEAAVSAGQKMVEDGADAVDIGGESTRPGAKEVSVDKELGRVLPVIEGLSECGVPIAIDTTKADVAEAAIAAGAEIVNDVAGGGFDKSMWSTAALAVAYICGHLRGSSMAEVHQREGESPGYEDVVTELSHRLEEMPRALRAKTIVDPGLGFGKGTASNLELTRRAGQLFSALQCAVMVGPSRKRFVADVAGVSRHADTSVRDWATLGAGLAAVASGAHLVRVHNVAAFVSALRVFFAARGPQR